MLGGAAIIFAGVALASADPLEAPLPDRNVRLLDLAEKPDAPIGEMRNPIVAKVPRDAQSVEFEEETALRLVRNRLPGFEPKLKFTDRIVLTAPQRIAKRSAGACFAARQMIPEGHFITDADVEARSCTDDAISENLGYDRDAQAAYATGQVPAHAYLGPVRPACSQRIAKDQKVQLTTGTGAVQITRTATTLQAGRQGKNVFVRTSDGTVFAVPFSHIIEDKNP